jgi:hypothetical protein
VKQRTYLATLPNRSPASSICGGAIRGLITYFVANRGRTSLCSPAHTGMGDGQSRAAQRPEVDASTPPRESVLCACSSSSRRRSSATFALAPAASLCAISSQSTSMAIVYSFSDAMRPVPPRPENQPLTHEDAQMNVFEILSTFVKQRTYPPTSPDRPPTSDKLGKDEI